MSRSGYSCEGDYGTEWDQIKWRGAVESAIKGKRGQAFLKELKATMDAMPEKRLIEGNFEQHGEVCMLGVVGQARGIDMGHIDPEDNECRYEISRLLNIAPAMAAECMWVNDEMIRWVYDYNYGPDGGLQFPIAKSRDITPEERFNNVYYWVCENIRA